MEFDLNCTPAQEEDILQDDINMEEEEEGIDPGHDAVGVEQGTDPMLVCGVLT